MKYPLLLSNRISRIINYYKIDLIEYSKEVYEGEVFDIPLKILITDREEP